MKDVPQLNPDWMNILLPGKDCFPRCSLSKTSHCPQWCRVETPNLGFLTSPAGWSLIQDFCVLNRITFKISRLRVILSPAESVWEFSPQNSRVLSKVGFCEISFPKLVALRDSHPPADSTTSRSLPRRSYLYSRSTCWDFGIPSQVVWSPWRWFSFPQPDRYIESC